MSIRIGMGVGFPFSGPQAFLDWIDLCEQSPIDSVWFSERLVSTVPNLEPMTAMAMVAGRTKRLKFGMNAIVLPFRDPLVLAKECATLDFLSGGRLLPAFGVGSEIAPEFRATSRGPIGRGGYSDEIIEIMTRLWTEEHVTHAGDHFQYEDVTISPRPKQQPLPVWIGGSSPAAIRRTARVGTGWLAGLQSPAQCAPVVAAIRREAAANGRPLDDDHYGAGVHSATRKLPQSASWPLRCSAAPHGHRCRTPHQQATTRVTARNLSSVRRRRARNRRREARAARSHRRRVALA